MENEKESLDSELYSWVQCIVVAFIAVVVLLTFVGRHMTVYGISMEPTFYDGDRIIVRSLFYTPDYGDVVIVSKQYFEDGQPIVKRVIALEGDEVDIDAEAGIVYVNGEALEDSYVNELTYRAGDQQYPYTVPDGSIFVMGDNRNHSTDSRFFMVGAVDKQEIIGEVIFRFYPFDRIGYSF